MASDSFSTIVASSSGTKAYRYDVFLSFRGEDTRDSFTAYLHDRLTQAQIRTFIDYEEIKKGEELKPEFRRAIKESMGSIIVLSENYATSTWCLDELLLILQQRRECNHFVLPVFYHVEPTDVRNQIGSFAIQVNHSSTRWTDDNVKQWKTALMQVADLSGEVVSVVSGPETNILKKIVETIYNKLGPKDVCLPLNITGMVTRYEDVSTWLYQPELQFLVIYGMGGSGKTTLAKYIYNSNWKTFEYVSFVEHIGSRCERPNGLLEVQEQLLKDILGGKERKIPGVFRGTPMIKEALQTKRTLIVLDDIFGHCQLVDLLGTGEINVESKIIITTRENPDNWLDFSYRRCQKYEMRLLNNNESSELLCRHAFRSEIPKAGFEEVVLRAIQYCEGHPLALEVLGSYLFKNETIQYWESQLSLFGRDFDSRIRDILVRSYKSLSSDTVKGLFLHIACFFNHIDMDYVVKILEHDYSAISGIKILTNRCLLSISPNKKLMMHKLVQDMGKDIVRQESILPAKRSRVWLSRDSYKILRKGKGSERIEGLALDMKMLTKVDFACMPSELKTEALKNMDRLKLLQLNFVELDGSYEDFSEDLRWLCWLGFHLRTIPSELYMGNLVAIDMSYSKLEVFEPPTDMQYLKILNLKDSRHLIEIRNIFMIPNLETLVLWNCYALVNVCKTIGGLRSLALLNMTGCKNLFIRKQINLLPASTSGGVITEQPTLSFPVSLLRLFLKDCHLECTDSFPLSFRAQPVLQYLNLGNSLFEFLPCYGHLKNLRVLDLSFCSRLKCLIGLPSTLAELYVYGCELLERITFHSHRFTLQDIGYLGCIHLNEVEGFFKLVPVAKLDETDLGHMNWLPKRYQNNEVCLVGDDELTVGRSWHIQMLYEFGIMSTSLPDIKDPNMTPEYISDPSSISSLSFDVPSCPKNKRLKGINVTFKYELSGDDWVWFCKISTTNGFDLNYNPKVFGKPEFGNVCIWLSYWPIGDKLNTGDKVHVSINEITGMKVHECGVSLVYADKENDDIEKNNTGWEEILGGDLSGFQLSTGAYYLCRRDYFELTEVRRLNPNWFRTLFGDTIDYTEVRGWRKTGRAKQVNDPSLSELKFVRCILHGPQLEDVYRIAEMSKSSFSDKNVAFTSSLLEGAINDEAMEEIFDKPFKSGDETLDPLISTFDDITMEQSDPYSQGSRLANLSMAENLASAPTSPPAPAAAVAAPPPIAPVYQSLSAKYESDSSHGHYDSDYFSRDSDYFSRDSDYFSSDEDSLSHSGSLEHSPSFVDPLLHGNLYIWIREAKNLPNMDMFHKTMEEVLNRLPGKKSSTTSDPYVSVSVSTAVIARTNVISNSENPVWEQHFNVPVAHHAAEVNFLVRDNDVVGSQLIGIVSIPVEKIYSGTRIEGFFPLLGLNGKPCKAGAGLRLTIEYFSIEKMSLYYNGVGVGPQSIGVPGTYFPLRRGGRVTLYQDAHVHAGSLPDFKLDQDRNYVHGSCWNDIFDAISKARRLIYITGWSVWHKVKLVRGVANVPEVTLGDLLKLKSQEGVRVLLLIWDDPTSMDILGYKMDGQMATHDVETRRFFKYSSVQVIQVPRIAGKRHSWMKQEVGIYTHHQKTVLVDTDAGYGKRRIIAFVGGLDLCDGRYDSPQHPLFRTLQTVHADDFHNPTFTGNIAGCPREPWHDMHSKIDGPAAYDVLTNFEERWLKASKPKGLKKLKTSYDDSLLRIDRVQDILGMSDQPYLDDRDPEVWHVQIFRSIDSTSVKGFPKDPRDATNKNLVCGKNVMIDMSIYTAYVKAIRSAQHFIYIENQYFIGSSFNWDSYKTLGANNLIPMEIALKIASKIRARERFAVYIVIPMWPEGVPTGLAVQRILYWQNKTMQMMYETIYMALLEVGLEGVYSPQDYLNFFCLGNREVMGPHDTVGDESSGSGNTPQGLARKSRRFMIYVHSKGMIVDDEYVIIGSANINQRSMEGTRDTEIAMGAYQPHHTWATKLSNPRGQIHGYRMSLWAEHLGLVDDRFTQPESIECVRHVRSLSEANWRQFAADEVSEMKGHLLKYPVEVDSKGKVRSLPGHENFPDVGGRIVGSFTPFQ